MRITLALWISAAVLWAPRGAPAEEAANAVVRAGALLDALRFRGGVIVHVGCGDGRFTAGLGAAERTLVHGLDRCAGQVAEARTHVRQQELNHRVTVSQWRGTKLPFAENFVNLLVVEDAGSVAADEAMRVLAPRGTVVVREQDAWPSTVKPWPKEMGEWTHWLHGPDGNAVAADRLAGPPRRWQWMAGPVWSRSHNTVPSVTAQVSAGGRLFYVADKAPAGMHGSAPDRWMLVARDAFNGSLLWKRPLGSWGWQAWSDQWSCRFNVPTHIPHRLVAAGNRVYVTLGFNAPVSELDGATGEVLRVLEGTENTDEILFVDGKLILSINAAPQRPGRPDETPVRKTVAMVDTASGEMLWKTGGGGYVGLRSKTGSMQRISHLSMVAGGGQVFFADGDELVSLSQDDGRELWRTPRPPVPENTMRYHIRITDMCTLVYSDGRLLFAQPNPDRTIDWREIRAGLHAFDARSGRELWSRPCAVWGWGHPPDVFAVGGLIWVGDYEERNRKDTRPATANRLLASGQWGVDFRSAFYVGLNPETGDVERKVSVFEAFADGHHHRCYRNKATERFLMTSYRGFEFIEWNTGHTSLNHWVRGTCRLGGFPCNGLLYSNPHPCACYIESKLNGMIALSPAPPGRRPEPAEERLIEGPAYGDAWPPLPSQAGSAGQDDWPTFRGDRQRSGATPTPVGPKVAPLWEVQPARGPLTGCTAGGGLLFAAAPETHEVFALHADDGRTAWRVTADGGVDTPPTFHRGRLFFGCSHGWVYCLRAADGVEVWRFRAAPDERLVGAFGRLESAWPVHGSLIVHDGRVYAAAGRSSHLDGGIFASVLDAGSGRLIEHRRIASPPIHRMEPTGNETPTQWRPGGDTGALPDILVCDEDEEAVYMRWHRLFGLGPAGQEPEARPLGQLGLLYSLGGFRDDSRFTRTAWFIGDRAYGDYLVFDAQRAYGVRTMAPQPERNRDRVFVPGKDGYILFAANRSRRTDAGSWSLRVPVRVNAMALAGNVLFAAGTPDLIEPANGWAAYDGRRGGALLVIDAEQGELLRRVDTGAAPAYDGMAAAGGRLYLATGDGRLLCFGQE